MKCQCDLYFLPGALLMCSTVKPLFRQLSKDVDSWTETLAVNSLVVRWMGRRKDDERLMQGR